MHWEGINFFNHIEKYWCMRLKIIVLSLIRGAHSKINVHMYNYGRCFLVQLFLVGTILKKNNFERIFFVYDCTTGSKLVLVPWAVWCHHLCLQQRHAWLYHSSRGTAGNFTTGRPDRDTADGWTDPTRK